MTFCQQDKKSLAHKEENHYFGHHSTSHQKSDYQSSNHQSPYKYRNSTGKMKGTWSSFTSYQDSEEKMQKKSSVKEILRGKKNREEAQRNPSNIMISRSYVNKYYKKGMGAALYKENKLGRNGRQAND